MMLLAAVLLTAGTLHQPRVHLDATLLPDGRVLVAGGAMRTDELEIFDPRTGTSVVAGTTPLPMTEAKLTPLSDGRVLITGGGYKTDGRMGFGNFGDRFIGLADATGYLGPAGLMDGWREAHTATRLDDGRVLIAGGVTINIGGFHVYRTVSGTAELYDPDTQTTRVLTMLTKRTDHTATLLSDGRVLIAGGNDGEVALRSAEIFDPKTETFTALFMLHEHEQHTATLLPDGRVLLAGDSAEIFDPATFAFTPIAANLGNHRDGTATLLRNGNVLLAGGFGGAEVYDPVRDEVVERLELTLSNHAAVLLPDGTVLLLGGGPHDFLPGSQVLRYFPNARRRAAGK